jgi:class 3 adenylate cyclase/predicted ATPase
MNVAQWLNAIDLGQYEALFRAHEIDAGVLRDLAEADLEKIGVPLGHRKRLLKAIVALRTEETAPEPLSPAPASSPATAERRPITVMFCDLVGSTSLAAKLDAEDWRTLVNTYLDGASAAVTGLGGYVLKKLGDGLMALFGDPHAQENDAERAVRAALAIQRSLVEINARNASRGAPELSARIGLDSGQVVVDATGEVFGDAPNIAARVQGAAEPGSILITATVQRQTAGLFVAEERGECELKGIPAPTTLYRIVRASGGGRRGGARSPTPLVGREEELDLLTRRWDRARKGAGQLALICGEPGLGKSRLIEEFHGRLGETPHTWVEWSSSQLLQNTPLHPITEWGRLRFGAELSAEQRLADLENTLGLIGLEATEYAPLLAPLVDVLLPEDRAAKLAQEELRRRQLAAMTAWILAAARTQAVVLAFEDLHWADPTSLDLMRALAERGAQAPLFIVATARPEFRPPWSVRSHHSVISLSPLDNLQIAKMVHELSARHALPRDIVEGVSERTGGVPLFVEEVTRLLLERGEQGGAQAIPPTLQQSLAARLDRLGSARETAQIGAVLGRGFPYALLQSVAGVDEGGLRSSLERLVEADILFVEGDGAQATYRFKHALIQDAAYDSQLRSRRQALHARAAEILRESASPEPEAIAHHFTQARLDDLAIEWWGKAGDQALRRSAFQEAIAHLGKAIAMADKASGGKLADMSRERQHLHAAYGNALIAARGPGAPETTEVFTRARERAGGDKGAPERLAVDYGLFVGSLVRGELPAMRAHAAAFLADVEGGPNAPEAGVAYRAQGITQWFAGEYVRAREHLERALSLFEPGRDDDLAFRFGYDAGASAMAYLAFTSWSLGDVRRARFLIESIKARMESVAHAGSRASGTALVAHFELMRGDPLRVPQHATELARLASEHNLSMFRAYGAFLEGWAAAHFGALDEGLEGMRHGVEALRGQNVVLLDGLIKIALAKAEARAGDADRAVAILGEALATSERTGHRTFDAELHRARGEILLKRDPANSTPGEEAFLTAITVAQAQKARSFELRAALSLAKLYQSTGRLPEAHAVLASALDGFSPTSEMPEIADAQALLAALMASDEGKAAVAQRERRLHLQTAYGHAMMWSKGFASEETKAAFDRAAELTANSDDFSHRFAALHGKWTLALVRGELRAAREQASVFLKEAETRGRVIEAGVAHRGLALMSYFAGNFTKAQTHCERALAACSPENDLEARERSGEDTGTVALCCLALTSWQLGEVARARELIDKANQRAAEIGHVPSLANPLQFKSLLEILRGDASATLTASNALKALSEEHGMALQRNWAEATASWAYGRLHDPHAGAARLERALDAMVDRGVRLDEALYLGLLAQLEAEALGADSALARVDQAIALTGQREPHFCLGFLHRLRGEFLLKREACNTAPAEEAYRTAIEVAEEQGARSYQLVASLSLAKLYQSTHRPADAHAVLAPALEGFAPTLEMPEIAEGQALMESLA